MATHCRALRMLCIKGTGICDSQLLVHLMKGNPELRVVSLSGVKGADEQVIFAIANHCPQVSELYVSGVHVNRDAMDKFSSAQPKCAVYGKRRRVSVSN